MNTMFEHALLFVFPAVMFLAAASDLASMTIPNRLSLALVTGFAVLAVLVGMPFETALWHLGAAAATLAVGFVLFAFGWMGGGDAKLAAATALWLGFALLPDYIAVTAIIGGVVTIGILILRRWPLSEAARGRSWLVRLHDKRNGVPYGVALALAALIVFPHSPLPVLALAG